MLLLYNSSMKFVIEKIINKDRAEILEMMREFYASDAVSTNGTEKIFNADIDNCVNENPYLEGYVFKDNQEILGYGMIAKSFSTEFGKQCIWFEDLYLKKEFRGNGIIPQFISFIKNKYKDCVFRLEAESYNTHALHIYKKYGFEELPYKEFINY